MPLSGVSAYDPQGDNGEHDDEAPLATDGDPGRTGRPRRTARSSRTASGSSSTPGSRRPVRRVIVQTDTPGDLMEIQAGASPTGPFTTVASVRRVSGTTTFTLDDDVAARYYVVWITDLGGRSVAHVNEVRARG